VANRAIEGARCKGAQARQDGLPPVAPIFPAQSGRDFNHCAEATKSWVLLAPSILANSWPPLYIRCAPSIHRHRLILRPATSRVSREPKLHPCVSLHAGGAVGTYEDMRFLTGNRPDQCGAPALGELGHCRSACPCASASLDHQRADLIPLAPWLVSAVCIEAAKLGG
jgi:hypothetical protein